MSNPISQKNTAFLNKIRSEQRQKIFAQERARLEQAKRREDTDEIMAAQNCLLEIFNGDRQEYEFVMDMADRLEKEERTYEDYLEKLEEESITYEALQRQKEIEDMKKQLLRYLEEEEGKSE